MFSNQQNGMNSMHQVNLNIFNNNTSNSSNRVPNNPNHAFLTHSFPLSINNNDASPDNSANSTSTPVQDPSLFMPTIGVIDNSSPPITSPNMVNATTNHRPAFIPNSMSNCGAAPINTSFRFDNPPNVSNLQSIPPQHLMQQMSTGPPTQTVLFNPQFVGTASNNTSLSPYQVHNNTPASYGIHNGFTASNLPQTTAFQSYPEPHQPQGLAQRFASQIPNTTLDHNAMSTRHSMQSMPLLQNENFNVSNLNVNPGFAVNDTLPPNVMTINPINILNAHHTGPKTLHPHKSLNATSMPHGAAKLGFPQDTQPIITQINSINQFDHLSFNKPIKRRGRPPKSMKKHPKTKRKKKKNSENAIEYLQNVEWCKAHSYHQYCPFCVRDERKKQKFEFWNKLPSRETLSKQERKEYDKQCKQLLQHTEDRVKRQVTFESGTEYRRHYDLFHKKYGFKCIYSGCCKESSSWYNFVAHLTQHDRESGRPFHCAYMGCNRRSSTKHNLIKHLQGVHKWRIINKEEPKQSSRTNVIIKSETESTESALFIRDHKLCFMDSNMNGLNHNNNNNNNNMDHPWNGNFDLKKDVVHEPIINPTSFGADKSMQKPNSTIMISPPRLLGSGMNLPPISSYANAREAMPGLNAMSNAPMTMNREGKEEAGSNNCIVSPHLITAITDKRPLIDEDLCSSHFSLPLNTKEYDNNDLFAPIYPNPRSPLSIHSRFPL
eukprot:187874_1